MSRNLHVADKRELSKEQSMSKFKASLVQEAKEYRKIEAAAGALKEMYDSMASLVQAFNELDITSEEGIDEALNIIENFSEIQEQANDLRRGIFPRDSKTVEQIEAELLDTDEGKQAAKELDSEQQEFLNRYFKHKSALGLTTQKSVAELTGMHVQQISSLESGKYFPQFKTIKKIADAFGIAVTDLIPNGSM